MRVVFMKYLNKESGKPEVIALASTDSHATSTVQLLEHAQKKIQSMLAAGTLEDKDIYEVNLRN